MSEGYIIAVIGPVVDVRFPDGNLPNINHAVRITSPNVEKPIVAEVSQHLGDNTVRCVALSSTDGLVRGCVVENTGGPITVPVGKGTLGRILNVLGEPVDQKGPIDSDTFLPIHRNAPELEELSVSTDILETGIKVIDLICPYPTRW
jgi:F-type H+-transporting ATPase subunit beta